MKKEILILITMAYSVCSYAQSETNTPAENILKISPAINFEFTKNFKSPSNISGFLNTGLDINYLRQDKLKNYHNVGLLIGFLPSLNRRRPNVNTYNGKQIGVEYCYRLIYNKFKDKNFKLFTEFGTQFFYRGIQKHTFDSYDSKFTRKEFIQNFVISPGIQFTKNKFFFDFSIPTSIGYSVERSNFYKLENGSYSPLNLFYTNKSVNLNWKIGFKVGVGVKF